MDYHNFHKILNNYIKTKKKHWGDVYVCYQATQYKNEYYNEINEPYLALYVKNWKMWQDLLKKYNHDKLSDYFVEIIRKDLPELKDIRLYIYNSNGQGKEIILELPKKEIDKFLYII